MFQNGVNYKNKKLRTNGVSTMWARRIVNSCYNIIHHENHSTILYLSWRALKFLHLQKQCYFDCPFCRDVKEHFIISKYK